MVLYPTASVSAPSGFDSNGRPSGPQGDDRRFDDLGVLKIGAALERALPWADK